MTQKPPFIRRAGLFLVLAMIAVGGLAARPALSDDTLKVALVTFPPGGADPRKSVSVFATYTWSPMFEALTTFTEDSMLVPELATAWNQVEPTAWTFTLREGVKFSNGRPLTAQDVVDNILFLKLGDTPLQAIARQLDSITTARVVDAKTIRVETSRPNAILPRELSALFIVEPDLWRKLGPDGFSRAPVGTGPFKLKRWTASRIEYEPNTLSWRVPKVKGLELLELAESTTRLQALLTGQADIALGMGPDERPDIEANGGRLHQRNPIDVISFAFVVGQGKPVDDVRVRRALNYAVDKDSIAKVILQGTARPATQGAVRGLLGYDPTLAPYPYDVAKAKALLKEAGFEKGFSLDVEVIISSNAGDALIYQYVANNLAAVNVKLNLISVPTAQMIRIVNQGEWKGNAFSQVFGAWPTFEPLRTLRLHSCLWPKPWYCDQAIIPTFNAALSAANLEERARLTTDVLRFYHDQATTILLNEIPILDGVAKRVKNYAPQRGKINYETIELAGK
jgi:peptide/nickel transport system substrate-binding protein